VLLQEFFDGSILMLDSFDFPKAMPLPGVKVIFVGNPAPAQRGDDRFGLGTRDDLILLPLEDDQWILYLIGVEFAGSRPVYLGGLGQRAEQ
jgi:hypothetical protein